MTAKSPWLYSSLCKKSGVFGEFEKCLTFCSRIQSAPSGHAGSAASSNELPPERKSLESEQDVYEYFDGLMKVRDFELGIDQASTFTNLRSSATLDGTAFTSPNAANNGKIPLSVSRRLFEYITGAFNISPAFLPVLNTGVARYISPSTRDETGHEWEQAQFIVQQNRSYSSYSIALTFSIKTGKVRALIFGTEGSLSELFDCLDHISPLPFGPLIIPTIALELQVKGFNETTKSCQNQIHDIEYLTGMRQFDLSYESNKTKTQDWKSLDLIDVTRNLSSFLSRFAHLKLQAQTGAYLIHQMQLSAKFLRAELERRKDEESKIKNQDDILSTLEDNGSWYLGIQARCRYLTERTQAQVQTVYSLISSQNSLSNISIAQASRDIAEASRKDNEAMLVIAENSRRDNQLMLQIAQDSRVVAVSTARDSAALRVIAAVTILFLPATFIATFFSMTFFDFTNDADEPHTSPWIWVYVLATVLLTIVIQTFWALLSKAKQKEIPDAS